MLELAVIENKMAEAEEYYYEAKPLAKESWMFGTTKANLDKIIAYRKERGEEVAEVERLSGMLV